jgi:hypothetical protein
VPATVAVEGHELPGRRQVVEAYRAESLHIH